MKTALWATWHNESDTGAKNTVMTAGYAGPWTPDMIIEDNQWGVVIPHEEGFFKAIMSYLKPVDNWWANNDCSGWKKGWDLVAHHFPKAMVNKDFGIWVPGGNCHIVNVSVLYKRFFDFNSDPAATYNFKFNDNDPDWMAAWNEAQGGTSGKGNGGRKRAGPETGWGNDYSSNTKGSWDSKSGWGKSEGYNAGWTYYSKGATSIGAAVSTAPGWGGTSSASTAAPAAPAPAPASSVAAPAVVNNGG